MATQAQEQVMISEKVAPVLVAKTLGAFDLVVIFVGIVLFIVNSASLQFAGPALFTLWIVSFLTFLITGGFITAQLGRMFPEEGSLYVWTHKVLGPFWGFFAGFVAWWPGPIVMMLAGILVVTFAQQIAAFADAEILTETWQQGIVILIVLWFGAAVSLLRMRLTQNYVNLQFFFYAGAIFVMGLAGLVWLWKGNASATTFTAELFNPISAANDATYGTTNILGLGVPALFTAYSFCVLALLGIEVPLNMGVEVSGGEDAIRKYLFWGSVFVMVAYLWTSFGNMVTLVGSNPTTGGAEAVGAAIGEWLGVIVALILLWFFLTSCAVYNYSFARLLFVSGLEKRLPHQIGRVSTNKVPANAVILQTVIASILTIVIFIGKLAGDDPNKPYLAFLAGVTIVWCISTALLFLDVFFAKRANPQRYEEARRVPDWFLYLCGVVGTLANVAAVLFIFVGQWNPALFPTLAEWNTWMIWITALSVIFGVAIYAISQRTRRGKSDAELLVEVPDVATAGSGGGP